MKKQDQTKKSFKNRMTSHSTAILEKMQESTYTELNVDFLFKLTNESERGALLIGGSKVEEYLENFIVKLLPSQQKEYTGRLLNYPGPLSSFAGKIELTYAFRVIDKRLYNSLSTLRKLRNEAAHSSDTFYIQNIREKLESIYDFEDGFKDVVHKLAYENLIKFKKNKLKKGLKNSNLSDYDYDKLWTEHVPNPDENETIQNHLIVWKLSYGLTFLCLKIEAISDDYSFMQGKDKIWIDINGGENIINNAP